MTSSLDRPIRVAMVEDDASYIETLRLVIETDPRLTYVVGFRSPVSFLNILHELDIDVLLLDINLPRIQGTDCLPEILPVKPNLKVIMLTVEDQREIVLQSFMNGAEGYLLKDASPQEVGDAIVQVTREGAPMSPQIARLIVDILHNLNPEQLPKVPSAKVETLLSKRERQVLDALAEGLQYAEIAQHLGIALDTVKSHVRSIYSKLEVRNRAEALRHRSGD